MVDAKVPPSLDTPLEDYEFEIRASPGDKFEYGEIFSPLGLIEDMFAMLPAGAFNNPDARWLDPGAGTGHFSLVLYHRLMEGLSESIPNCGERRRHIVSKMLYMAEIKPESVGRLRQLFGEHANILSGDFTTLSIDVEFDFAIGNPPYNANGMKKVPTNSVREKKDDGRTMWIPFVKKTISLLKPQGHMLFIIPSIWMKPDRAAMYPFLTSFKLDKIKCLTNTQTNQIFHGEAQTPTCCLTLCKTKTDKRVGLYDKNRGQYVDYPLRAGAPIPLFGATIVKKLIPYVRKAGHLKVTKTNMPPVGARISPDPTVEHTHQNIKTCLLNGVAPTVIINYSDQELPYAGKPKLVLAHKMYGFPYLDAAGSFGISNRDNYVITDRSIEELEMLRDFLATKTALYLFETARYRMKYLEKYAFEFIPDITKLPKFPRTITDESIAKYFKLDTEDVKSITALHRRAYVFIPSLSIPQN